MAAYTLDAVIASTIMLAALAVAAMYSMTSYTVPPPPDRVLGMLVRDPGFVGAVYDGDTAKVKAYLDSFCPLPYTFTVYEGSNVVMKVGEDVQGIAATAELIGWRGVKRVYLLSLRGCRL